MAVSALQPLKDLNASHNGVLAGEGLKATSHSTIFDIPMHPVCEDQRHPRRFTC